MTTSHEDVAAPLEPLRTGLEPSAQIWSPTNKPIDSQGNNSFGISVKKTFLLIFHIDILNQSKFATILNYINIYIL